MNVLLISEDYVRTNSNLNDNVFGKWILPAIREAQEMGLMPIIGECLYKRICEMVDNGDIDKKVYAAYKDLLDEKIQPYLLYQTLTNIVPLLNGKMGNIGTVATNDEHIVTLSQGELDLTQNYYRERADFYAKRLQEWVKANDLAFPELNCGCGNMKPNLERSNNSVGMWLGGARGKKVRSNDCGCKTDAVRPDCPPCRDYDEGYQSGYTSGHTDGYGEGYEDGYDKGQEDCPDCVDAYESGYTSGYTSGQTDGFGEGFESGYTSGHSDGITAVTSQFRHIDIVQNGEYYKVGDYGAYSSITVDVSCPSCVVGSLDVGLDTSRDWEAGVTFDEPVGDGWSSVTITDLGYGEANYQSGYTSGHTDGYDDGYGDGYTSGYTSGSTDGYNNGYGSGYTSGFTSGRTQGYGEGYASGWTSGYSSGYTSGYTDGASQQGDLESITFDVSQDTETIYPHSGYIGMSSVVVNAGDFGDGRYAEGYEDGVESMHVQDVKYDTPTYTEGEPYTVTPDFEYDSMASVELDLSDVYGQGYSDGQDYGESLFTDGATAITATTNGVYTADTENYMLFSSVTVDVSGTPCNLEGKSVVLTAATQTVEPSSGYDGISAITIDATGICESFRESGYTEGYQDKNDYLTFEATASGGVEFCYTREAVQSGSFDTAATLSIEYQKNNDPWVSLSGHPVTNDGVEFIFNPQISVDEGDIVRFRANNTSYTEYVGGIKRRYHIWTSTGYLYGNIMSLLYGDNFRDKTELKASWPLGNNEDYQVFMEFFHIFGGQNGFHSHPIKELVFPATGLTPSAYYGTFKTTLIERAPILPATSLQSGSYREMFYGCRNLRKAPEMSATNFPMHSCDEMFRFCTNLNYIKCLGLYEELGGLSGREGAFRNWVENVAPQGTFVKDANTSIDWQRGSSGIPIGWTVYDEGAADLYQAGQNESIAEIASLSTGLTATTNGTYTADTANKVYFSSVTVDVSGSTGSSLTGNFVYYFTEDGTQAEYNPDAFFDASGNLLTAIQDDYTDMGRIIFDGNIHHIGADDGEGGYDFAFPASDETGIGKITHLILPDTVVSISGLTNEDGPKIGFPANLEEIGGWFLKGSPYIEEVYMPDTVTAVTGGYNFELPSLSNVHVSESLETLGDHAFYMAQNLSGIELPETLTSIGDRAFEGCQSLSDIYCYATTAPTLGNYVFGEDEATLEDAEGNEISSRVYEEGTLYVPSGSDYSSWAAQLPENWTIDDSL